jgi:hypothetical protein
MRARPWCRVFIDMSADSAWVRAKDAKQLIEDCGGRAMWSPRRHDWHTSAATATDVLALADARGYAVTYERAGGDAA